MQMEEQFIEQKILLMVVTGFMQLMFLQEEVNFCQVEVKKKLMLYLENKTNKLSGFYYWLLL